MVKMFCLNDKKYEAKEFDFNFICDLEEAGISLTDAQKMPFAMIRAYVAQCMGTDKATAAKEMQAHMVAGGNFNEIINVMAEKMQDSDFFRALSKNSEA